PPQELHDQRTLPTRRSSDLSEAEDLHIVTSMLQPHCNILTAEALDEGLEIAFDVRPDVILIDAGTAAEDDHRFCRQLVRSDKTSVIPVVLIVEEDAPEGAMAEKYPGVREYLRKPLTEKN